MPQWGPFLVVVAILTVLVLVLARQSQEFISDRSDRGTEQAGSEHAGDGDSKQPTGASRQTDISDTPTETHSDTSTNKPEAAAGSRTGAPDSVDSHGRAESGAPEDVGPPDSTQTVDTGTQRGEHGARTDGPELTGRVMLANVASTQALFAGVVVTAAWYFSIPAAAFGITAGSPVGGLRAVGLGIGFGAALWLANELATTVAGAVGAAYDESVRRLLAPESVGGWVGLFLVVLPLVALAEELLFRAALVGVPAAGFGVSPWLLAVVASLAFALGHGAQGQVGVVVTGLLGLVLAAGYILTGSLLVVVVAHYVINSLEFIVHELFGVETMWPFAVRPG